MKAMFSAFALLVLALATGAPCLADEDYCGELAADALTFNSSARARAG